MSKFKRLEIVVFIDHVVICGQKVVRPSSISPSQWMRMFEEMDKSYHHSDSRGD